VSRRFLVLAASTAAALVILVFLSTQDVAPRAAAVAIAALGLSLLWLRMKSLSQRTRSLAAFVDAMLDARSRRAEITGDDDELEELSRSLARMAPRIDELVNRLSSELTRREAVLTGMTDAVLAVDSQLHVTFCNHAFVRALGDHSIAEGTPLIHIARDPALRSVLKQVVDSGEPARARIQLTSPEGRFFEVHAAPLEIGGLRGAIAILHDVTPRERLERVKRDFIANVSHEFRTPLATIRGYAETLLEGGLDDRENRRKFVEIIHANAVRLNNIAADLLTLSELDAGQPEPAPGPVAVGDAVSAALHAVEPTAALRGLRLCSEPVPEIYILGFGIRLEQVLLNLLDNAVKFNHENGEVRVVVRTLPEGTVKIAVSDTGIGIPAEDLSRIFERFYRVDKARSRRVGGTGLGLSIVKHAVEQMQGDIAVESRLGQGTIFTITLPRYQNGSA
jgi:two-component system phosphate regulon sensor histidine kinase PhoR